MIGSRFGGATAPVLFAVMAVTGWHTSAQAGDSASIAVPTLVAHPLSAEDEAAFSGSDGRAAPFWAKWPASPRDRIEMRPSTHANRGGRDEFTNDDDARLSVRAAHGARGLYLFIEVDDDEWSPIFQAAGYDSAYDGIEIMFDSRSAAQIDECGKRCRPPALARWDVTDSARQIQVWTDAKIGRFKYLHSGPDFFPGHELSVADAPARYDGLAIDRFPAGSRRRVVEVFLPWSQLGGAPGARMAFSISYNDNDRRADNPYMINTLRWVDGGNPFSGTGHWGDILLEKRTLAEPRSDP